MEKIVAGVMVFIDERLDQVGKYVPGGIGSKDPFMSGIKFTFGIWDEGEDYPYMMMRCSSLAEAEEHWADHVEKRVDFWADHLDGYISDPSKHIVVKDQKYTVCPDSRSPGWGDGHSGSQFRIKLASGEVITTRNLWYNGVIPKFYRNTMKPNAEFIDEVNHND
jgi:hypothetical protein